MAHAFGAAATRDSVLDLIGNTPLMRLNRLPRPGCAEVVVKLEAYNPAGSVKDRIALAMIEAAERSGELQPGATIVDPTRGNTGIGLALVAAVKGYRLIITMPADSSQERQDLLRHFGAEVILTPARKLMRGAIERAEEIVAQHISAGISGGAAVWGALRVAAELGPDKRVVSLIPDAWERCLSVPGPKVQTGMDFVI